MKLKKFLSLGLVATLTTTSLIGCSSSDDTKETGNLKITLVSDVGGINDESFNQSAWEGLQRAKEELGVEISVIESKQAADYAPNIEQAVDNDSDLVIGVGFTMDKAVEEAAKNYPENKFAIIDYAYENQPENVNSLMFNAQEAAYLVGVIAAKKTETNKLGFIGGSKSAVIESFEYGFLAGAESVSKDIKVLRQYADTYTDAAKGKAIANQMYADDVDVIFTAAGSTGNGAIEAAKESGKMAIGVDKDQNSLAPENIITSAMKRVDMVVYNVVNDLVNEQFKGGQVNVYGLKEEGVGIAPTTNKNVSEEILTFVQEQSEKIKLGEIKVPKNEEEYNSINK